MSDRSLPEALARPETVSEPLTRITNRTASSLYGMDQESGLGQGGGAEERDPCL